MTAGVADRMRDLVVDHYTQALGEQPRSSLTGFWELGGSSFQFAALIERISRDTGITAPMSVLLQDTSVDGVTAALSECAIGDDAGSASTWVPSLVRNCVLRQRLAPNDTASNCLMIWQIDGAVDRAAVTRALRDIPARHESLRSWYSLRGEIQHAPSAPGNEPMEYSAATPVQAVAQVVQFLETPLSPNDGLVQRSIVVEVGTEMTVVGIVAHHAAFDGYSESVIAYDLGRLYALHAEKPSPKIAPGHLPLRAAYDLLAKTRTATSSNVQQTAAQYFAALPDLPLESRSIEGPEDAGALTLRAAIPDQPGLATRAAELGVTYFGLLATAYARALQACLGATDIVFGVPVNRRIGLPLAATVGNFVAMVPMRVDLGRAASLTEAVRSTQSGISAGFAHMDLDYEQITKLIPPANKGRAYRHVFALQDNPAPTLDIPGAQTCFLRQPYAQLANDTMLEVWPAGTGYADGEDTAVFSYRPSVVSSDTADNVLNTFLSQLAEAVEQ